MSGNPKLYEINTRVWVRKLARLNNKIIPRLDDIPDDLWHSIAEKGFDAVWMMGIWKTARKEAVMRYCFPDYLTRNYDKALKDWTEDDVIGSPYALDKYEVNPELGDFDSLLRLKSKLNSMGMKLILDFVSNHFSADSSLIQERPGIFLQADEEIFRRDSHTYFQPLGSVKYFAHGRDPFFPAWEDTIQVNYFSPEAIDFMTDTLLKISRYCDGVRCDMAMLELDNVFYNTWSGPLNKFGYRRPGENFWVQAIRRVREQNPDFIFIAEAYWDLEWDLQQLGFNYTYDKRLTDRLISGTAPDIRQHLMAEPDYQRKSVRFIENHDEERAFTSMGKLKSLAAATIISTIQGMRFYYQGQMEGKRIKLPVQLGRETEEPVNKCISDYYERLLGILKLEIFRHGDWKLLECKASWDGNISHENILTWIWNYKDENCLVAVNYSDVQSQCRVKFDISGYEDRFTLRDLLTGQEYSRSCEEVYHQGLYIDLKPWQSHIMYF